MNSRATIDQMRRHIAELCVTHEQYPVRSASERTDPASRFVQLGEVGGPRGYCGCLHRTGVWIGDPAAALPAREARAWADSVALDVSTRQMLELVEATLGLGVIDALRTPDAVRM